MKKLSVLVLLIIISASGYYFYNNYINTNSYIIVKKIVSTPKIRIIVTKLKAGETLNNNTEFPMEISYDKPLVSKSIKFYNKTFVKIFANFKPIKQKKIKGSLQPEGNITLPEVKEQKKEQVKLKINSGTIRIKIDKLYFNENFKVKTPAAVCGVRGTKFTIIHKNNNSIIKVPEGIVAVNKIGETKEHMVKMGYKISVTDKIVKPTKKMTKQEMENELKLYYPVNYIPDLTEIYRRIIYNAYGRLYKIYYQHGKLVINLNNNPRVKNLKAVTQIPVKILKLENTNISNIDVIKKMDLISLDLENTNVHDLTALKNTKIKDLYLGNTNINNIDPLKNLPLNTLSLWETSISDINILKNKNLKWLSLSGTPVSDISILKNMYSLKVLCINESNITDISTLKNLKLEKLLISPECLDKGWKKIVQQIPTLKVLGTKNKHLTNNQSIQEFWKNTDK